MILGAGVVLVGVAGTLAAEWRDRPALRWVFKPLASAGFLLAALRAPALVLPTGMAWLLFAGLVLSAVGDVLLIPKGRLAFIGGIVAFSLAHVAYGVWFVASGVSWAVLAAAVAGLLVVGHLLWRWLDPHVTGALRIPVRGYVALVSVMAACATVFGLHVIAESRGSGLAAYAPALAPAAGGLLFYLSDLAVARHRFVAPGFTNRAWGLPAYYLAQLLIASAIR